MFCAVQNNDHREYILPPQWHQMEDWMSGLNQQFTKLSTGKTVRGFESHILRKIGSP